jgi:hypothetical protein
MSDQTPIPVPLQRRWEEFRVRLAPVMVFVLAAGLLGFLWRDYVRAPANHEQVAPRQTRVIRSKPAGMPARPATEVAAPVAPTNSPLTTGEASHPGSVSVPPKLNSWPADLLDFRREPSAN